ncbi:MAG: hypothetical protein R3B47_17365 [Bacteroidia bacterium]
MGTADGLLSQQIPQNRLPDSWLINIQPKFWKELKALFTNMYPDNAAYLKMRKFYSFYLMVYLLLFAGYVVFER